jgi:Glycosyltransferase family 87
MRQRSWLALILLLVIAACCLWIHALNTRLPNLRLPTSQNADTPIFSDFYPRWRGAYEWLYHGADPYSPAVTRLIHTGLTGELLTPDDPVPETDSFAYPLYFALLIAPLTLVPYPILTVFLYIGWFALVVAIVWGWNLLAGGRSFTITAAFIIAGCSLPPATDAILLQQPVVLSVAALTGAAIALNRRHTFLAGALLAVATIKPQTCLLLVVLLGGWVVLDLRGRYRLAIGFGVTFAVLAGICLLITPSWPLEWVEAFQVYTRLAPAPVLLAAIMPSWLLTVVGIVGILGAAFLLWQMRAITPQERSFAMLWVWPLWASYLVFPSWPYEWLLVYPALILIINQRSKFAYYGRVGMLTYAAVLCLSVLPLITAPLTLLLPSSLGEPLLLIPELVLAFGIWIPLLLVTRPSRHAPDVVYEVLPAYRQ